MDNSKKMWLQCERGRSKAPPEERRARTLYCRWEVEINCLGSSPSPEALHIWTVFVWIMTAPAVPATIIAFLHRLVAARGSL